VRSGVAFVVNPASGRGRGRRIWEQLEKQAGAYGMFEAAFTEHPRHGVELAKRFVEEGWPRVIAVGGDGTLNEVLNGVIGSESALGSVPLGTGNDWIRSVGIPSDPKAALEVAFKGQAVPSDVGLVEGHGYFLNVIGAGFDADVAQRIANAKGIVARLGPTPRYIASVLGSFRGYRPPLIRIHLDGHIAESRSTLLVAIGIAQYYGSGMRILPQAKIDDGLFDLAWGSDVRFKELLGLLRSIYKGKHIEHPKVSTATAKEVSLSSEGDTPFHIDGDVRGVLPIKVSILEKAIQVIVPGSTA
jgi:diacylglycerol kinase (ATP)